MSDGKQDDGKKTIFGVAPVMPVKKPSGDADAASAPAPHAANKKPTGEEIGRTTAPLGTKAPKIEAGKKPKSVKSKLAALKPPAEGDEAEAAAEPEAVSEPEAAAEPEAVSEPEAASEPAKPKSVAPKSVAPRSVAPEAEAKSAAGKAEAKAASEAAEAEAAEAGAKVAEGEPKAEADKPKPKSTKPRSVVPRSTAPKSPAPKSTAPEPIAAKSTAPEPQSVVPENQQIIKPKGFPTVDDGAKTIVPGMMRGAELQPDAGADDEAKTIVPGAMKAVDVAASADGKRDKKRDMMAAAIGLPPPPVAPADVGDMAKTLVPGAMQAPVISPSGEVEQPLAEIATQPSGEVELPSAAAIAKASADKAAAEKAAADKAAAEKAAADKAAAEKAAAAKAAAAKAEEDDIANAKTIMPGQMMLPADSPLTATPTADDAADDDEKKTLFGVPSPVLAASVADSKGGAKPVHSTAPVSASEAEQKTLFGVGALSAKEVAARTQSDDQPAPGTTGPPEPSAQAQVATPVATPVVEPLPLGAPVGEPVPLGEPAVSPVPEATPASELSLPVTDGGGGGGRVAQPIAQTPSSSGQSIDVGHRPPTRREGSGYLPLILILAALAIGGGIAAIFLLR